MAAVWTIAKASVIGTSHERSGAPCQDSSIVFLCEETDQSYLVLAVSDGAGSAKHSEIGSQRTVDTFVELVQEYFKKGYAIDSLRRGLVLEWIDIIRRDLEAHASELGRDPRDYSCTLLAAIVGEKSAAFIQIGDGAIVVSNSDADGWSYIYWPQHGEFANSTNFVLSARTPEIMQFEVAPRAINEIAVFTDGIENLVLHSASRSVHQPFFAEMIKPLRSSTRQNVDRDLSEGLAKYLASPSICSKTDDDKTLILASRCPR